MGSEQPHLTAGGLRPGREAAACAPGALEPLRLCLGLHLPLKRQPARTLPSMRPVPTPLCPSLGPASLPQLAKAWLPAASAQPSAAWRPQNHWPEAVWTPPVPFMVETSGKRSPPTAGEAGVSEGEGCAGCADAWFLVRSSGWALPQALADFATGRLGRIQPVPSPLPRRITVRSHNLRASWGFLGKARKQQGPREVRKASALLRTCGFSAEECTPGSSLPPQAGAGPRKPPWVSGEKGAPCAFHCPAPPPHSERPTPAALLPPVFCASPRPLPAPELGSQLGFPHPASLDPQAWGWPAAGHMLGAPSCFQTSPSGGCEGCGSRHQARAGEGAAWSDLKEGSPGFLTLG